MADGFHVNPDLGFINNIIKLGGKDLKKCFQCATCSVACPISPDTKPFPRKEMLAASWGLKNKLINNGDIWLCHNCGDCSSLCPRGAKPSDVLSAIRIATIKEYAKPKIFAKTINEPKNLPILLFIPILIFALTGFLLKMIGINWINFSPTGDYLWQADYISNYLVDLVIIPTFFFSMSIFIINMKEFLNNIHANALVNGTTKKSKIDYIEFVKSLTKILPNILKHKKFNECSDNQDRSTPHMMILFSFIALFVVTQCFFIAEWIFHIEGPYRQINPIKWLGNTAGIALIIGSCILIKNRLAKKDQLSTYEDWLLIGIIFGLGLTGIITEMLRLGGLYNLSAIIYLLHLISVWLLFACAPFSKLAHFSYRLVAMIHQEYTNRT